MTRCGNRCLTATLTRAAGSDALIVLAIPMPVLTPTCVITHKLRAFDEHNCDFGALLPGVRAVREAVDWPQVRAATADSPFATAFLCLCGGIGIAPPA